MILEKRAKEFLMQMTRFNVFDLIEIPRNTED